MRLRSSYVHISIVVDQHKDIVIFGGLRPLHDRNYLNKAPF